MKRRVPIVAWATCVAVVLAPAFAAEGIRSLPESPQRAGDPERGYRYLIEGDYVRSGPPLAWLAREERVHEAGFERSGANVYLPYWLTATTAPNGAEIATPNCLHCHAQRLDGELIVGLGNAGRDYTLNFALGMKVLDGEIKAKFGGKSAQRKAFLPVRDVMRVVGPQIRTPFIGVNPADKLAFVLAAHRDPKTLEWSNEPFLDLPPAEHLVATDVPALWLLRKKNTMFYTGVGRGDFARLMMAASLLTFEDVEEVRSIEDDFVDLLTWIETLEPPPWPGSIDTELALRGKALFAENCTRCHGKYGVEESYPNLLVPLEEIGTDALLAEENFTIYAEAIEAFNASWFASDPHPARLVPERGYVAPPLDGVWATAPYLHNGSVPTLMGMLDSTRRPPFWRRSAKLPRYDRVNVGLHYKRKKRASGKKVYDTSLPGYGNEGHTFGDSFTEDERRAVVEYLKTL